MSRRAPALPYSPAYPRSPARHLAVNHAEHTRYFPSCFPISIRRSDDGRKLIPRFCFLDEGATALRVFESSAVSSIRIGELMRSLPEFGLIYVSDSQANFASAEEIFQTSYPIAAFGSSFLPLGLDHFLHFLEALRRFDARSQDLIMSDMGVIREGDRYYKTPVHMAIREGCATAGLTQSEGMRESNTAKP